MSQASCGIQVICNQSKIWIYKDIRTQRVVGNRSLDLGEKNLKSYIALHV